MAVMNQEKNTTTYDDLLRTLAASPKINNDIALADIEEMVKKAKVQELIDSGKHRYAVTKRKNGGMSTYVIGDNGKRKMVSGRSERAFYDALYRFYFGEKKKTRMCDLFEDWLQSRRDENISGRTIKRYKESYGKYLKGTVLDKTPIVKITPKMCTEFFNEMIRTQGLTNEQYGNIVVIPNKLFQYAVYKEIIHESPMAKAMVNRRALSHRRNIKTSDRIYYEDEKRAFLNELQRRIDTEPRSELYAIALLWKLGLRIGEVVALKMSDIDERAREIHIQRMETRDENDRVIVVDHLKKNSPHADRRLPLSEYELSLFRVVKAFNERNGYDDEDYVFQDENGRRKARAIDHWIRMICDAVGIPQKSEHDIRRTVASELFANGESLETIRDFLGHREITTTAGYIIDPRSSEEICKRRQKILSCNDLKLTDDPETPPDNVIRFVQHCATKTNAANH